MYLTHLLIVMQYTGSRKVETYYCIVPLFVLFVGHSCMSAAMSFILVLLVEVPMYKVQKKLIFALTNKKENK